MMMIMMMMVMQRINRGVPAARRREKTNQTNNINPSGTPFHAKTVAVYRSVMIKLKLK